MKTAVDARCTCRHSVKDHDDGKGACMGCIHCDPADPHWQSKLDSHKYELCTCVKYERRKVI